MDLAAATGPSRLGSSQHVVVGAIRACGVYLVVHGRRIALPEWAAFPFPLLGVLRHAGIAVQAARRLGRRSR